MVSGWYGPRLSRWQTRHSLAGRARQAGPRLGLGCCRSGRSAALLRLLRRQRLLRQRYYGGNGYATVGGGVTAIVGGKWILLDPTRLVRLDRLWSRLHKLVADCIAYQCSGGGQIELAHHCGSMRLHRLEAQPEDACNLFVGVALRD